MKKDNFDDTSLLAVLNARAIVLAALINTQEQYDCQMDDLAEDAKTLVDKLASDLKL